MAAYTLTLIIDSKIMAKQSTDNLNIAKKGKPSQAPLWTVAMPP